MRITKKEINKELKQIRKTLQRMQKVINNNKLEELDRSYFEDLMCLSSQLYRDYAEAYDPE